MSGTLTKLPVQTVRKVGIDVKSSRPLRPGLHTCYNGRYREQPLREKEQIYKTDLSSDRSLQLDSVKLESLVIGYQQ